MAGEIRAIRFGLITKNATTLPLPECGHALNQELRPKTITPAGLARNGFQASIYSVGIRRT
jgi:hypothetical protein